MNARLACVALVFLAFGCGGKMTVPERQQWLEGRVRNYVGTIGYDRDTVEVAYDPTNRLWIQYWDGQHDTMLADDRRWHEVRHTVWIYRIVDLDGSKQNLWVFVDRGTYEIKGHLAIH